MVWVAMASSARRANRSCRVAGMGEGSKLRGFRDGGVVRLARLLLAEPPPTRQQTRPHARCLAAPTGTSLLGNPVVWLTFLAHFPGPASWPSFLAQSLDPGGNGPLPPFPCRRPGLQSAKIGTPGRACLPMGPILLHKTGHCRSDG